MSSARGQDEHSFSFTERVRITPRAVFSNFEAHYAMPRMVRFGELTYREIRHHADVGCLALVPTGCTEQQGPHLPVSFDSWLVETIACASAEEAIRAYGICVLVLPTLPFGPTPEHRGFGSGYIDIPRDLHEAMVGHVLASLCRRDDPVGICFVGDEDPPVGQNRGRSQRRPEGNCRHQERQHHGRRRFAYLIDACWGRAV